MFLVSDGLRLDHHLVGSLASRCMVPLLVVRYVRCSASVRFFMDIGGYSSTVFLAFPTSLCFSRAG